MGHLLFFLVSTLGIAILSRIKEVCERVPTPSPDSLVQGPSSLECEWDTEHIGRCLVAGRVAAAAKSLQSCPTLCDPIDSSPLGSPVPGFSRQEHWSGLPFPSPMNESEKWKWSRSVVSDPQRPHGLQPSRLLCPWDFPGRSTGVGCHCW